MCDRYYVTGYYCSIKSKDGTKSPYYSLTEKDACELDSGFWKGFVVFHGVPYRITRWTMESSHYTYEDTKDQEVYYDLEEIEPEQDDMDFSDNLLRRNYDIGDVGIVGVHLEPLVKTENDRCEYQELAKPIGSQEATKSEDKHKEWKSWWFYALEGLFVLLALILWKCHSGWFWPMICIVGFLSSICLFLVVSEICDFIAKKKRKKDSQTDVPNPERVTVKPVKPESKEEPVVVKPEPEPKQEPKPAVKPVKPELKDNKAIETKEEEQDEVEEVNDEPAKDKSFKNKEENEQLAENEFEDEQPDAVTSNCKLYLKEKVLVIRNLDYPGHGTYRMGQRFSWVRINLEDIVRVVDEEGSPGNVYTRTFYSESLNIETKDEDLHIGSSQHDYYEYMDPGSSFFIYTKDGQYEIDYDKKEVKTVWDWIVDYFNTKTKQDQTTTGAKQKQEVEVEKEEIKSPKEGSNDFVIMKGDNWNVVKDNNGDYYFMDVSGTKIKADEVDEPYAMFSGANCIVHLYGIYGIGNRIPLDNISSCVKLYEYGPGERAGYAYHTDGRVEKKIEEVSVGSSQHDYYDYMEPGDHFYIEMKNGNEIDVSENVVDTFIDWIKKYGKIEQ